MTTMKCGCGNPAEYLYCGKGSVMQRDGTYKKCAPENDWTPDPRRHSKYCHKCAKPHLEDRTPLLFVNCFKRISNGHAVPVKGEVTETVDHNWFTALPE